MVEVTGSNPVLPTKKPLALLIKWFQNAHKGPYKRADIVGPIIKHRPYAIINLNNVFLLRLLPFVINQS